MDQQAFQVAVIGAGPAGYAAAFRAADLGLRVALIDPEAYPGGVCLHRGCIPSKSLLHVARFINETREVPNWGVDVSPPRVDLHRLRGAKHNVIEKMTQGLGSLARRRAIQYIRGTARFLDSHRLSVDTMEGNKETLTFEFGIIATGSKPAVIPSLPHDTPEIMDSTGALELKDIPETLLCIGGGIIGLELATVYAALGSRVTVVEALPKVLAPVDPDLTGTLMKTLKTRLEAVYTGTRVHSLNPVAGGIEAFFEGNGLPGPVTFQKILMAVGRSPNTGTIGLEQVAITTDEGGFIKVNDRGQTGEAHIYAIGDVIGEPMLAHKGTREGHAAAESIAGKPGDGKPSAIPSVVYTDPEVAWVGLTEKMAKEKSIAYGVGKFPWAASGRAASMGRADGLTKALFDPGTGKLLGVGITGTGAGELIGEATLGLHLGATAGDLASTVHAHPTLSETLMEAAEAFLGHSDHYYVPKRNN